MPVPVEQVCVPNDGLIELLVEARAHTEIATKENVQLDLRQFRKTLVQRCEVLNRMRRDHGQPTPISTFHVSVSRTADDLTNAMVPAMFRLHATPPRRRDCRASGIIGEIPLDLQDQLV